MTPWEVVRGATLDNITALEVAMRFTPTNVSGGKQIQPLTAERANAAAAAIIGSIGSVFVDYPFAGESRDFARGFEAAVDAIRAEMSRPAPGGAA